MRAPSRNLDQPTLAPALQHEHAPLPPVAAAECLHTPPEPEPNPLIKTGPTPITPFFMLFSTLIDSIDPHRSTYYILRGHCYTTRQHTAGITVAWFDNAQAISMETFRPMTPLVPVLQALRQIFKVFQSPHTLAHLCGDSHQILIGLQNSWGDENQQLGSGCRVGGSAE